MAIRGEDLRITQRPTGRMAKKQLAYYYDNYDQFYNDICGGLLFIDNMEEEDILSSYAYGCWLFEYYAYRTFKGPYHVFLMKFRSRFQSTFYEMRQKDRIYRNIYTDLKLEIGKLVDLKNTEYHKISRDETGDEKNTGDETWNRERTDHVLVSNTEKSGNRQISKERPFESLDLIGQHFGNMVQAEYMGRADWLGGEDLTIGGYIETERYPEGHEKHGEIIYDKDGNPSKILNPNWSKQFTKGTHYDNTSKQKGDRSDHRKYGTDIIDKTVDRQEQPLINGQIARIVMGYKNFETYPTDYIMSFGDLFTEYFVGGGKYYFNEVTWDYEYVSGSQLKKQKPPSLRPQEDLEEETDERKKIELDPNRELSFDEWEEIWKDGKKPCMPTWYLESVLRYKKGIEVKIEKEDIDWDRLKICDTILHSFYRAPYIPPMSVYESIMGTPEGYLIKKPKPEDKKIEEETNLKMPDGLLDTGREKELETWLNDNGLKWLVPWTYYRVDSDNIKEAETYKKRQVELGEVLEAEVQGFSEFKASLWEELRVAHRRKKNKVPNFQVFPYLIGPPGTGKSEISRRLAQANKAPIWLINCSGINDPEYFEGKRPTLANASAGKCMAAFTEASMLAEITIDDLKDEIKDIKMWIDPEDGVLRERKNLTGWEEDKINQLDLEIKEWELENQERENATPKKQPKLTKKKAYRSRAPIILLDEFEKMADQAAQDVIGKMTDRENNFSFRDNYFGFRLDLSNAQFLMTANYLDKVPQFIKDRGTPVNIELLTWATRKVILRSRFKKEMGVYKLSQHLDLIDDKFIDMCIPETWGVRGGINNIAATVKFLEVLEVEREEFEAKKPGAKDPYVGFNKTGEDEGVFKYTRKLSDPDIIEETSQEDYLKKETGVIRLIYKDLGGKRRELVLAKRIGIEARTLTEDDVERKVKEIVTGNDAESGKIFVPDWGGDLKKYVKPDGSIGTKDDPDVRECQWWYGYKSLPNTQNIGYIVKSLEKVKGKPDKPTEDLPNLGVHNIRGWFRYRSGSDNNYYTIDNVNSALIIDTKTLAVKKIKLVAQTAMKEREKYEIFVNHGMSREYDLTINNEKDVVWDSIKQQITIFCKWDVDETI